MGLLVEICVQGIRSALAAAGGGADRIELCEDLSVGGVTPSAGVIALACERLTIPAHVLIRPRGGDFVFDRDEVEAMERDVETARSLGAAGVVVGALRGDGTIDVEVLRRLIERARPLSVTFHRAFDVMVDPVAAVETLMELGADRVLTSGQAATAREGLALLAALQRHAGDRLTILAGGRVGVEDVGPLHAAGLREIHVGSAAGAAGRTEAGAVRRVVAAARAAVGGPIPRED